MTDFLHALYGDCGELWWYVWTLGAGGTAKYTHWFQAQDIPRAAELCAATTEANVYYPIGLTRARGTPSQRATIEQVQCLVGLVADIDHKPGGCPDEQTARTILQQLEHAPTYLVHSGHGLQAGWLFREPWVFDTPQEHADAQNLALAWGYTVAEQYNRAGYEVDAVHDLTRIMRVPGTMNVKGDPVPCVLRELDADRRYNPQELSDCCIDVPRATMRQTALPSVDVSSAFPTERHELLMQEHDEYRATWEHTRKDLNGDCSRHDMALASYAAQCGWSDDEITAMLVAHRQKHGRDKPDKLHRADYYARTIHRARQTSEQQQAQQQAADTIQDATADGGAVIKALAERWEIPLTRIDRVTGDPAVYRFWIGGKVAEVAAPDMVTQGRFLGEILSVANVLPRAVAPKEKPTWRDLVNRVAQVAETIEGGDGTTRDGALLGVLTDMIEERGIADLGDDEDIHQTGGIFRHDGRIWFSLGELVQKCKVVSMDGRVSQKSLAQRLRAVGAVDKQFAIKTYNNRKTIRRCWGVSESALAR